MAGYTRGGAAHLSAYVPVLATGFGTSTAKKSAAYRCHKQLTQSIHAQRFHGVFLLAEQRHYTAFEMRAFSVAKVLLSALTIASSKHSPIPIRTML
jgi:hypothetical protein